MKNIVFGAIMPHPPILVPEVGRGNEKQVDKTVRAAQEVAQTIKGLDFDTLVVITPHGRLGQAAVPVYTNHIFEGNFSMFGAPKPLFRFRGDPTLAQAAIKDCDFATNCAETMLDHGALVPLDFIKRSGIKKPILLVAIAFLPLQKLFEFGESLAATCERMNKKVVVIASADMSHRLTPDAPGGYSPRGKDFDHKLVELVKNYDVSGILNFDPALASEAGQDALWSIAILLGAFNGVAVKPKVLSYEGPFGVGYMVAELKPGS
ncbi:MAG: AmmeMemoRadiSam system protein B [Candidatus Saganbacteria bacterium]|nr:AmmeMemoRadiSam system protein B [Candidatus Saganbacteria bacterium]